MIDGGGIAVKLRSATRNVGLATAALSLGAMAVGLTSTVAFAQSAKRKYFCKLYRECGY